MPAHRHRINRAGALTAVALTLGLFGCGSKNEPTAAETVVTPVTEPTTTGAPALVVGEQASPTVPGSTTPVPTTVPQVRPDGATPLTAAQAFRFSQALVKDHTIGGAHFVIDVPYGPAASFHFEGTVDWTNWRGTSDLTTDLSSGPDQHQTVWWTKDDIVEPVVGLPEMMMAKGRPGIELLQRPLNPLAVPLDKVIVLVNSLANTRAENPILLRQRGDTGYFGESELDGVTYSRFVYASTTFWVGPDGSLGRVESSFAGYAGPVVATFTDKGPKTITLPDAAKIVNAAEIPDVLNRLRTAIKSTN